ncbi:MAG: SdiA-regulated domain-containing protein [Flavobacteriales bacterium]|nr:SdiA-regulated domain-containing protein [Flavobacteriales bacterium]
MKNVVRFLSVVGFSFIVSCIPGSFEVDNSMILEKYSLLPIYEPSGLSYSADRKDFYTVSDRGELYKINTSGSILKTLPYTDDDFEGVTVNPSTSNIYVVKERTGELVKLNSKGVVISTTNIIGESGNNGLEGLTYDAKRDRFYMLKEKNKGLLITFSFKDGVISKKQLSFATDYSGLFYNQATDNLWIVSQESRTITKCTVSGKKISDLKLPIYSMEGIVVNDEETEAFVVSDKDNAIYKVSLLGS